MKKEGKKMKNSVLRKSLKCYFKYYNNETVPIN